jgi:hypothetical protein
LIRKTAIGTSERPDLINVVSSERDVEDSEVLPLAFK